MRLVSALSKLLAGKTPESKYDALHAGRYLSALAQGSPPKALAFIKGIVRSSRQRKFMPATLYERLAAALAESELLNEAGKRLALEEATD